MATMSMNFANGREEIGRSKRFVLLLARMSSTTRTTRNRQPKRSRTGAVSVPPDDAAAISATPPEYSTMARLLHVEMQKDNPEDVATALHELGGVTNGGNDRANRDQAILLGALGFVLSAMRSWQHEESVQLYGCYCLTMLTFETEGMEVALVKSGGIETVVDALRTHFDKVGVQEHAFGTLINVFNSLQDDDTRGAIVEAADRFVNKYNGVGLILSVMKHFADDVYIQENGCIVLSTLASKKEFRSSLMRAVATVGTTLEKFEEISDTVKTGGAIFMNRMFHVQDEDEESSSDHDDYDDEEAEEEEYEGEGDTDPQPSISFNEQ